MSIKQINPNLKENNFFSVDFFITAFICFIASYLICLNIKDNIYFHTDGIAPIKQILLMVNSDNIGLTDLRLARIPSLLPDLSIVYIIAKLTQTQDLFVIQATYAFLITFLYLIGTITIPITLFKNKFSPINSSLITIITNLLLIKFSPFFREAIGHFLTPVHQGGNILMTIIFIPFLLIVKNNSNKINSKIKLLYLLFSILGGLAIASNKLFVFSVILPLLIIKIISTISQINNWPHSQDILKRIVFLILIGISIFLFGFSALGVTFGTETFSLSWYIGKLFQSIGLAILVTSCLSILALNKNNYLVIRFETIKDYYDFLIISIRRIYFKSREYRLINYYTLILFPSFIIANSIFLILNTQCMSPVKVNIISTLSGIKSILITQKILLPILIIYSLILLSILYKQLFKIDPLKTNINVKFINSDLQKKCNKKISSSLISDINFSLLFISLSGLSPIIYLWLAEGVYSRYLLITILLFPLIISILLPCIIIYLRNFIEPNKERFIYKLVFFSCTFILLSNSNFDYQFIKNISFKSLPLNNEIKSRDNNGLINKIALHKIYRKTALRITGYSLDHEQINSLGLENGLSDFWSSSVSEIGPHKMIVSPIGNNGEPDLWAHSKYNFLTSNSNKIRNYNFVYTRSNSFTNSIINAYGKPSEIYKISDRMQQTRHVNGGNKIKPIKVDLESLNSEGSFILFYPENSDGWKNIQQKIANGISIRQNKC